MYIKKYYVIRQKYDTMKLYYYPIKTDENDNENGWLRVSQGRRTIGVAGAEVLIRWVRSRGR